MRDLSTPPTTDNTRQRPPWHVLGVLAPTLVVAVAVMLPVTERAWAIVHYDVKVLARKPQARDLFVQGLEIVDGKLYVSTGNYGESRLLRYNFDNGELEQERKLNRRFFAEGVTVLGDKVYQLTWRNRGMLVYDRANLRPLQVHRIAGEGWGLTNNGKELIYSDGSAQLHVLSPLDASRVRSIEVTENGKPLRRLNELEWVDGIIWANIWQTDRIVMIDPDSGAVCGSINLAGLLPGQERRRDTDVLNGIARNPADGGMWVTGKRWPWLYQIELVPSQDREKPHKKR